MKKVYLSKEKLGNLQKELEELRTVRRKEIADDLKYAKSLGDLSENAEYQEARTAQAIMESRIMNLEGMLKNVEIVASHHSETVEVGSTVDVSKENDKASKKTYEIVGSEEADTELGKISNESPLGQAMMGKKKGDAFKFETPSGKVSYTILDIK